MKQEEHLQQAKSVLHLPFIFLQAYDLRSTSGKIFSFCVDLQGELWCDRAEEPDRRWRQYSGAEGQ